MEYYSDADQDGFGRSDDSQWFCTPPTKGWSTVPGDCNDTESSVFPGQTAYFGAGYSVPGGESFDYDCSGSEEPDPEAKGAAPSCAALALLICTGSGFAPTGRRGNGISPSCGSTELVTCSGLLVCAASSSVVSPKGCR